jgi:beta-phosphoglucomutase-like phosphatase (HAD superfamily)
MKSSNVVSNCIVFEDAISGFKSAQNAGIPIIIGVVSQGRKNVFENVQVSEIINDFYDDVIYTKYL